MAGSGCAEEEAQCRTTTECSLGTHCVDGQCGFECQIDYECRDLDLRCDDRGRCIPIAGADADTDVDTDSDTDGCVGPSTNCYGSCVLTDSDELNCGDCGVGCDFDEECAGGTCIAWVNRGCSPQATGREPFAADLVGCPGTVSWDNRWTLCGAGWSPCSAAQWIAGHGGAAPEFDYWTSDDLRYSGDADDCWVDPFEGSECTSGSPMRVCTATGNDTLGNECNWANCGYEAAPPLNHFFGGCEGNDTAGTLCCQ